MKVLHISIERFRGFDDVEVVPRGHVLLVGEPRAGRSDLLSALNLVLDPDAVRGVSELDFHNLETNDAVIKTIIGDLGSDLEQRFLDQLEFWDPEDQGLVEDAEDPSDLADDVVPVVRMECRLRWDDIEERPQVIVYWSKFSDPDNDEFRRVSREDRLSLPFVALGERRPLNLAPRGALRAMIDGQHPGELSDAIDAMASGVESLAAQLTSSDAIAEELSELLEPLLSHLGVSAEEVHELLRFLPEGGTVSGLLRSLAPALALDDDVGLLPLARHGSTTTAQIAAAEAVAMAGTQRALVIVDDFGDSLDVPSAQHLGALLRNRAAQVWLSTRRAEIALRFESEEIVRLARAHGVGSPRRTVHYGRRPQTRGERVAARELDRQILPVMTARGLIIGEGPHDRAAYDSIAERLDGEEGVDAPEAFGVRVIDSGGGAGGVDQVPRVAQLARDFGFRVVALIDYDQNEGEAASRLAAAMQAADAVVRLPKGVAVERALLRGVSDEDVVSALLDLNSSYSLPLPPSWRDLTGDELMRVAVKSLKSNNGLHAQFVTAVPGQLPPLATAALQAALECARGVRNDTLVQL